MEVKSDCKTASAGNADKNGKQNMTKLESAALYAKEKHKGQTRKNGITPYSDHLEAVVSRLKSIGISDEDVLCAGWLHDTMEDTDATFDELSEIIRKFKKTETQNSKE